MSEDASENKGAADSLQSFQSMNINDGDQENNQKSDKQKIDILLKPTGNAPIMKKKKWTVEGDKPISWIAEFMKRYMKLEPQEKLFLYVNQTFAPSPDQIMKNLYDCYSTEGKLVLHYCKTPAWG
ncbi:autophagy protein 12-like [Tribolium castaneum]|uniref:Ubiquitin-like protein ATG12 n=1 Tax=Tribolium castaneum TaxID=7070 RepID=D2A2F4_TRICA|nr:PREDICTED: autophagy protein 12-like [Tribolium castaneum]EFA02034.1 Autophagy protein 12-like [Tribolium castaneum]|eukprot:XP_966722.1 PREDICTED: autophagy protein 12-like [Tribolium castaneum]